MKKLTSILLFVAMILTVAVIGVSAAAGTDGSITVVADKTTVEVGEEVTVTFKANATAPVGSIDFHVVLPEGVELVSGSGRFWLPPLSL